MSHAADPDATERETVIEEYVGDVRIVRHDGPDGEDRYAFEAPHHTDVTFDDAETARLYADVYFDANGFREEGTGDYGIPPEVVQAGKDTMAAYLLTRSHGSTGWVASFYGTRPEEIDRYESWVRGRAEEIRQEARRQANE